MAQKILVDVTDNQDTQCYDVDADTQAESMRDWVNKEFGIPAATAFDLKYKKSNSDSWRRLRSNSDIQFLYSYANDISPRTVCVHIVYTETPPSAAVRPPGPPPLPSVAPRQPDRVLTRSVSHPPISQPPISPPARSTPLPYGQASRERTAVTPAANAVEAETPSSRLQESKRKLSNASEGGRTASVKKPRGSPSADDGSHDAVPPVVTSVGVSGRSDNALKRAASNSTVASNIDAEPKDVRASRSPAKKKVRRLVDEPSAARIAQEAEPSTDQGGEERSTATLDEDEEEVLRLLLASDSEEDGAEGSVVPDSEPARRGDLQRPLSVQGAPSLDLEHPHPRQFSASPEPELDGLVDGPEEDAEMAQAQWLGIEHLVFGTTSRNPRFHAKFALTCSNLVFPCVVKGRTTTARMLVPLDHILSVGIHERTRKATISPSVVPRVESEPGAADSYWIAPGKIFTIRMGEDKTDLLAFHDALLSRAIKVEWKQEGGSLPSTRSSSPDSDVETRPPSRASAAPSPLPSASSSPATSPEPEQTGTRLRPRLRKINYAQTVRRKPKRVLSDPESEEET